MQLFTSTKCVVFRIATVIMLGFTFFKSFSQQAWTRVPSPDTSVTRNLLNGISGTSSSDVWAVGHFEAAPAGNLRNYIMHWNGVGWQIFSGTDLSSLYNDLRGVTVISSNDVWAAGSYNEPGTTRSQLLHWNGLTWTHSSLPAIPGGSYLSSIDAITTNDVWAVGAKAGSPTDPAYTLHYNGITWTEFPAVNTGTFRNFFNAVDGLTSNDVWAVGYSSNSYGDFHAMAQHWNGSSWSNVTLPASITNPLGELSSVTMISSNNVWAIGSTATGNILLIHWDGASWSEVAPTGFSGGAIIARGTDLFSVGDKISQWNGSNWVVIEPLNQLSFPSLTSATVFSNGDIWAAGRTFDTSFHSLVYRTANAMPQFIHGNTQTLNAPINTTLQNIDEMLRVDDADLSQVVVYSTVTSPSHGTLSGLPDTAITSNNFAVSSGVSYMRSPGYTGADQFVVKASVGPLTSQVTINVTPLAPLPVVISNYSVSKTGTTTTIKWSTVTEVNTKEFIVERSSDGINFSEVSRITAHGSAYSYSVVDPLPLPGLNFYRLVESDIVGRITAFPVKTVRFDKTELKSFVVYPNPIEARILSIQSNESGKYKLMLFNWRGQKIIDKEIVVSTSTIHLTLPHNLSAGTYMLSLTNEKSIFTKKIFIK